MSTFELVAGGNINAFDQGFNPETSGDLDKPDPAGTGQGTGPDRVTLWVPTENVMLSAGAAIWGSSGTTENAPSTTNPPEVDAGFVAQTNHHIHFHTFGDVPNKTPGGPSRTIVRLGTPVTAVKAGTSYGLVNKNAVQDDTDIGTVWPGAYTSWDGYVMLTEGGAYQESNGPCALVSGTADLRLAGKSNVLLGSPGDVHIAADSAGSIADFARNDGSDSDFTSGSRWRTFQLTEHIFDISITALKTVLGVTAAIIAIVNIQDGRSPTEGKPGWDPATLNPFDTTNNSAGDILVVGATLAAALAGGAAIAVDVMSENDQGCVSLYGSHSTTAYGALFASVHSGLITSVSADLATLISGSIASISSLAVTSVQGSITTLGGLFSAGLSSPLGSAKVNGKSRAELSSPNKVYVTGKQGVQVNSTDSQVYVHGRLGFYVGCGGGPPVPLPPGGATYANEVGFGVVATNSLGAPGGGGWLRIGRMNQGNNFWSPVPDSTLLMTMQNSELLIQHRTSTISMRNDEIYIGEQISGRVHIA